MNFSQTFILGIVAALIGFYFQQRSWRNQHFEKLRDRERVEARTFADEVFNRIDRRLALQRRYLLQVTRSNTTNLDLDEFSKFLDDWNGKFSSTNANLRQMFGGEISREFDSIVHCNLQENLSIAERTARLGYSALSREHKAESDELLLSLSFISYEIKQWMRDINRKIENGEFGRSKEIDSVYTSDYSLVTRSYLLKRLLNLPSTRI